MIAKPNVAVKLAAIQYRPPKGDPDAARVEIVERVEEAAVAGADLIVLPEMATTGYIWHSPEDLRPHAEPAAGGATFEAISPIAAAHGAWVVVGFPEIDDDARLYNSALVVAADGSLAGCYRKILLFEADYPWAQAGGNRPIFDTPMGRLAPAICMDMNDGRLAEHLCVAEAEVLALPLNWLEQGLDLNHYWLNCVRPWSGWIVAANTWGEDEGTVFAGRSAILSPSGEVIAQAPTVGDATLYAEL